MHDSSSRQSTNCGCAGLKEEETNPQEDAAHNEALQTSSHASKNTAVWRLLDGPGATPEVAARTPVANRTAAGRLDFVLQVCYLLMHQSAELQLQVCLVLVPSVFGHQSVSDQVQYVDCHRVHHILHLEAPEEVDGLLLVHDRNVAELALAPLQTGPTENPWLSAISSHFGYWTSPDIALFVLRALHGLDVRQGIPKAEALSALSPVGSPPATPATPPSV